MGLFADLVGSPLKGAARSPCELRVLRRLRRLVEPERVRPHTPTEHKKKAPDGAFFLCMAERVGFEPTIRFDPYT